MCLLRAMGCGPHVYQSINRLPVCCHVACLVTGNMAPECGAPATPCAGNGRPGGHVIVLTEQHTAWGWGANAAGQLGLGVDSSTGSLAESSGVWAAAPLEVMGSAAAAAMGQPAAVACGDEHSVLMCRSGGVYAAGRYVEGACGLPVVQLQASEFSAVALPRGAAGAAAVSCGGRNTAIATATRRLLVWGCNDFGQAATGRVGGARYMLTDIGPCADWHGMQQSNQQRGGGGGDAAAHVVGAACGSGSQYALAEPGGEVFSWGQGGQGERYRGIILRGHAKPTRCCCDPSAVVHAQLASTHTSVWLTPPPPVSPCRRAGAGGQLQECVHPF
jgi:alpha-tubulin suppressor-like RCC1 family protein